jgi:sirohydrochlorin cobaltochelatase
MPAAKSILAATLDGAAGCSIGQIHIQPTAPGFVLTHGDDVARTDLKIFREADDALDLAKWDDAGRYRPLKTAPNLRHGWRMELSDLSATARAIEYFYPARLAAARQRQEGSLKTTSLRETLNRQTGMYRVAARISDDQIDRVVGDFCRSEGGCLRTILWTRDVGGGRPSTRLLDSKYDPDCDQTGRNDAPFIPLLCQESCNLLVNECRRAAKS